MAKNLKTKERALTSEMANQVAAEKAAIERLSAEDRKALKSEADGLRAYQNRYYAGLKVKVPQELKDEGMIPTGFKESVDDLAGVQTLELPQDDLQKDNKVDEQLSGLTRSSSRAQISTSGRARSRTLDGYGLSSAATQRQPSMAATSVNTRSSQPADLVIPEGDKLEEQATTKGSVVGKVFAVAFFLLATLPFINLIPAVAAITGVTLEIYQLVAAVLIPTAIGGALTAKWGGSSSREIIEERENHLKIANPYNQIPPREKQHSANSIPAVPLRQDNAQAAQPSLEPTVRSPSGILASSISPPPTSSSYQPVKAPGWVVEEVTAQQSENTEASVTANNTHHAAPAV